MAEKSILKEYLAKHGGSVPEGSQLPEAPVVDDIGSFGWLRGIRDRALMLEIRLKDGSIEAFPYSWLERARFDPTEGVTLTFGGCQVHIHGRNLNAEVRPSLRLFEGITRHRVPWLRVADQAESMEMDEKRTVIDGVEW